MRILIAEDDDALRVRLTEVMTRALYLVDGTGCGEIARHLGEAECYDAIVLDLGLPVLDGMSILRSWREAGVTAPVLVLTGRDTWRDKVDGLRSGADDYLGKPFESEELLARLEALIRRAHGRATPMLCFAGVELDPAQRIVRCDGHEVALTAMEYRTLHYLGGNAGRVIAQDELIEHIYSQEVELGSNVVEVIVSRIRRKLGAQVIRTRRGHGYLVPVDA